MTALPHANAMRAGLLARHPGFDGLFIAGTLALALGMAAMASISPAMLLAIVLVDTWLFANPHVMATLTRIGASMADIRRHRFLIFGLPVIVLGGVVATVLAFEVAGLFTLYFCAQSYHVARQSFGIARAYRRLGMHPFRQDRLAEALIYLIAAWGLLARCAQAPEQVGHRAVRLVATQASELLEPVTAQAALSHKAPYEVCDDVHIFTALGLQHARNQLSSRAKKVGNDNNLRGINILPDRAVNSPGVPASAAHGTKCHHRRPGSAPR